jgi:hypothetical protein
MQKTLMIFLLLLAAVSLSAQDSVVLDTTFTENRGGGNVYVNRIVYASGRIVTDERPLSSLDTLKEIESIIRNIFPALEQYAANAVAVASGNELERRLRATNQTMVSLSGKTYFSQIDDRVARGTIEGDYNLRFNGTRVTVSITRLASGNLRYREGGLNYAVDIISRSWLRIRNYKSGNMNFFWDNAQNVWTDVSGTLRLQKI